MPYIANKPGTAYRSFTDKDTFTGDGSTVAFDMTYAIAEAGQNDLQVFVNDVRQIPGDDYTLGVDDTGEYKRITFTSAPTNSHAIVVLNPGTVQGEFSSVADNAVTTNKLFDGAVTTGKLAADAVDGTKIADDAIDSEHITDGSVDNVHLANSSITINGTSIDLGASGEIVAGTDWQAVITAAGGSNTAVAGEGYFIDTTSATHTINLPSSPSIGDTIKIVIIDGDNTVTVGRNSNNINGVASDYTLSADGDTVEFVYSNASEGWKLINSNVAGTYVSATGGTETTSGNFKIHTFTSSGCFVVSSAGNSDTNPLGGPSTVDYLVVAGGGAGGAGGGPSGGSGAASAGGGAGGFRESKDSTLSSPHSASPLAATSGISIRAQTYPITVGAGGSAPPAVNIKGSNGSNSVFSTITAAGGGAGGTRCATCGPSKQDGNPGGSGGGAIRCGASAGSGNTPPVSPPQGNPGGTGTGPNAAGGGGGGAGAAGTSVVSTSSPSVAGGAGGNGATTSISSSPTTYAGGGGGGGGGDVPSGHENAGGAGGSGGGGAGGSTGGPETGSAGTANTGGGGGGGGSNPGKTGGAGGSGIVIIRYRYQ